MLSAVTPNLEVPLLDAIVQVSTAFQAKGFPAAVAEIREALAELRAAEEGQAAADADMARREDRIAQDQEAVDLAKGQAEQLRRDAEQAVLESVAAAEARISETDRIRIEFDEYRDAEIKRFEHREAELKAIPGNVEKTKRALARAEKREAEAGALKARYLERLAKLGLTEAG